MFLLKLNAFFIPKFCLFFFFFFMCSQPRCLAGPYLEMLAPLNFEVAMPKYVVSAHKLIKDFQDQSLFTEDNFQSHSTTLYVSRHAMNLNH